MFVFFFKLVLLFLFFFRYSLWKMNLKKLILVKKINDKTNLVRFVMGKMIMHGKELTLQ